MDFGEVPMKPEMMAAAYGSLKYSFNFYVKTYSLAS